MSGNSEEKFAKDTDALELQVINYLYQHKEKLTLLRTDKRPSGNLSYSGYEHVQVFKLGDIIIEVISYFYKGFSGSKVVVDGVVFKSKFTDDYLRPLLYGKHPHVDTKPLATVLEKCKKLSEEIC